MAARIRRLTGEDRVALEAFVADAAARGDLLASSAPDGSWLVPFAMLHPATAAVAEIEGRIAGVVLPDAKAVVVAPELRRRGIGRALVDEAATIEHDRGNREVLVGRLPGDVEAAAFLAATGFSFHSTLWDLELAPGQGVASAAWPAGARPRPFDRTRDSDAWVDLFNAAFATHPTPLRMEDASAVAGLDEARRRDADTLLVEWDGVLAGFCATDPGRGADGRPGAHGEIWTIGVRPGLQGRGLGRALLRWGVAYLRSQGVQVVRLSVSAGNEGALALYESEGFRRSATRERWARPVTGLPGRATTGDHR